MQFGSYLCGFKNKKVELGTDYESSLFIKSNPTISNSINADDFYRLVG